MIGNALLHTGENLAARPGVNVEVSIRNPTGRASRDPNVLLTDPPYLLDGQALAQFVEYRTKTYDTYDGLNKARGLDWYAIHFPEAVALNCIVMTMECPNRDGGWWTSLWVEYLEGETWQRAGNLLITPDYSFADVAYNRRPYETYALTFSPVTAASVRIIGQPGGLAQFTSLSYLAVFNRENPVVTPSELPRPPMPYLFRLIPPTTIWDLSESLAKLTGTSITVAHIDHHLDQRRYERWWQRISRNFQGEPDVWHLMGVALGWDIWNAMEFPPSNQTPMAPYVLQSFQGTLARAVAPIVVDNAVVGDLTSQAVLLDDIYDEGQHMRLARDYGLPWGEYRAALQRTQRMTQEQLEGAAELLGMIANTIANLAHENARLERELLGVRTAADQRAARRRQLIQQAVQYMHDHLEDAITVSDVARAVALSPTYFGILFAEQTGKSPVEYLIDLRIERAKQFFAHTSMSVMDVCVALSYNPSYFNRLFRQRTGMTPGQYARRHQRRIQA
jgi:AraC-like DNA-binding protein